MYNKVKPFLKRFRLELFPNLFKIFFTTEGLFYQMIYIINKKHKTENQLPLKEGD